MNRLGTDPGLEGGQAASSSRTVADWLWPFLVGGLSLFSISALFYYHFHRLELEPTSFLQQLFAGLYDTFGWAPLVVFFLLVFAWSTIWFVTGVLERPGSRLTRLLVMAVMLGLFLNLGDGGVAQEPHKGAFGAWLASRLVAAVGYLPSLVLVWFTTFASLLLATDWFFSEWFERLRPAPSSDVGVEGEVTDHLRALGQDPTPAPNVAAAAVVSDAGPAPSTVLEASGPAAEAAQGPEPQAKEAEPEPAQESYADRRRARAARRLARGGRFTQDPEPESSGELGQESAPTEALTEAEVESFYEEPATEDVHEPGGAAEPEEDLIVVAPEHVEAEELELEAFERGVGDGAAESREGGGHPGAAEVSEREVEVDLGDDVDFAAETLRSQQDAASASGDEAETLTNDRAEGASAAASAEYAVTAGDGATAELEEESEDEADAEYEEESEDDADAEYEEESEDEADAEYEEES
ncbi:MAG: hypothetical protein VYA51_08690, partial [Planctomycetota bacterium]|nr:hypothetical protein [Planctomycetota bacterium]